MIGISPLGVAFAPRELTVRGGGGTEKNMKMQVIWLTGDHGISRNGIFPIPK
jgi:hypothetical protein